MTTRTNKKNNDMNDQERMISIPLWEYNSLKNNQVLEVAKRDRGKHFKLIEYKINGMFDTEAKIIYSSNEEYTNDLKEFMILKKENEKNLDHYNRLMSHWLVKFLMWMRLIPRRK